MANPKIQLRHDTAANWASVNPVLLEGEVGIETDTRKQKFGDGTTAWNSLPYDKGSTALQSITSTDVTNALGYTPVNKAGDTMTGTLNLSSDLILLSGGVYMSAGNTSKGTIPTNDAYQAFFFRDTDSSHTTWQSSRFGACEIQILSSGENRLMLRVYKNQTNSTGGATLMLGVDANDNQWCTFPNTTCVDGQWVNCFVQLTTATAIGDYQIDLTNYLPNDGYKYEIMISGQVANSNSTYGSVYINNAHAYNGEHNVARVGTNCRTNCINCTLPVDNGRSIYMRITGYKINWETHDGWTGLYLVGYRRIGSNS